MKNTRLLIAAAVLALFASASQVKAGGSDACCKDNTAASPKVRTMLNEQCNAKCAAQTSTTQSTTATRQTDVAASPKLQQMRAAAPVATSQSAGSQMTGSDGIAASPKVRSMLDERHQTFEIAPQK